MSGKLKSFGLFVALPGLFFVLGYSGVFQSIGKWGTVFLKNYAEAELAKLEANSFINEAGNYEYVIAMKPEHDLSADGRSIEAQPGVLSLRKTDFDHWYVVEIPGDNKALAKQLDELTSTQFVLANRGTWLCH